jgi:hypothetical protein
MVRSNIFQQTRKIGRKYRLFSWIIFFIVGFVMAVIAFFIEICSENLIYYKNYAG